MCFWRCLNDAFVLRPAWNAGSSLLRVEAFDCSDLGSPCVIVRCARLPNPVTGELFRSSACTNDGIAVVVVLSSAHLWPYVNNSDSHDMFGLLVIILYLQLHSTRAVVFNCHLRPLEMRWPL
jgi:hypothetical protein